MPLTKLAFRPGINTEITAYSNEGGWIDCDKVRFRFAFPEKIGGWARLSNNSFLGACRNLHPWVTLSGDTYVGLGTSQKFYVESGGSFYDITPIRATGSAGSVTFSASNGSAEITVTQTSHGASEGDFVTFSNAVSLGGNITADVLNQEYQITSVASASTFTIEARTANTPLSDITVDGEISDTPVLATASDTGNGGSSAFGTYQISVGLDTEVLGSGWGSDTWSSGAWGEASSSGVLSSELRLYSQDNFGEDLLFNVRDGSIYYFDSSLGLGSRAVAIQDLSGASYAPTIAKKVLVSDRDRHVIAFGCDPEANPGVQDPLIIRFSDQESITDWQSLPTNTAGELRLGSGSEIITAVETRQQTLVFTDTTLYSMQYLGPPFTFGVNSLSESITIASPNSAIAVGDAVFWMGSSEFYVYDGSVSRLPCTVRDTVFDNLNVGQNRKIFAGVNAAFSEVWWFYPSSSSDDNDKYVVYNYAEKVWYVGNLARSAWVDRGISDYPIASGSDGYLYLQENGLDDGSTNPATALSSYLTSAPLDIGDGEKFAFVSRLLPDVGFRDSTEPNPLLEITTRVRNKSSGSFLKETQSTINSSTELVNLRLRGRQMSLYIQSLQKGTSWRLGSLRYDLRTDGER